MWQGSSAIDAHIDQSQKLFDEALTLRAALGPLPLARKRHTLDSITSKIEASKLQSFADQKR